MFDYEHELDLILRNFYSFATFSHKCQLLFFTALNTRNKQKKNIFSKCEIGHSRIRQVV